jgi:hypothetical protein
LPAIARSGSETVRKKVHLREIIELAENDLHVLYFAKVSGKKSSITWIARTTFLATIALANFWK